MLDKLRCERCGETFEQHWKVGHPCIGFLHDPEKKLVLKSKTDLEFKPLNQYGGWVIDVVPANEIRRMLQEQIKEVIPPKARYRRCILFTNRRNVETLITTITWKYTPNPTIMAEEANKTSRFLLSALEEQEYQVTEIPFSKTKDSIYVLVHQATPRMILTADRAWACVKEALAIQQSTDVGKSPKEVIVWK